MSDTTNGVSANSSRNLSGRDFLVSLDDINSVLPKNKGIRLKGYDGYPIMTIEIADRAIRQRVLRHLISLVKRRDRNIAITEEELDISSFFPADEDDVETVD